MFIIFLCRQVWESVFVDQWLTSRTQGHGKYEYWLEASKNTKIKVQQLYIEKVNELIIKHGLQ